MLHSQNGPRRTGECLGLAAFSLLLMTGILLLFAWEGAICLAMAFPIALLLAWFGILVRGIFAPFDRNATLRCIAPVAVVPLLMAIESKWEPEPALREVRTSVAVAVAADPATIWPHVIAFSPLPEPDDWLFRTGIAYPQRAELVGSGVGAVRHGVFSTGAFVEPIDVWEPPTRLRFQVTEQPAPMREWSPWAIEPPHLEGFLVSRQGQFRLVPLDHGTTRLEGTTWYTNRMWPSAYWGCLSDWLIGRIHRRVLDHVAALAQARAPSNLRPER